MNARKRQMRKTMNTIQRRKDAADGWRFSEARASFDSDPYDPGWWDEDYDPDAVPATPSFPLWERLRRTG